MSDAKHINESELDELLREFSLDTNADTMTEAEAQFILSQNYDAKIDAQKEKAVIDKLIQFNKPGGNSTWFFLAGIIGLAALFIYYIYPAKKDLQSENAKTTAKEQHTNDPARIAADKERTATIVHVKRNDTFGKEYFMPMVATSDTNRKMISTYNPPEVEADLAIVPLLIEKDKLSYNKIKEQMLRRIIKNDKGLYTHVPAYKVWYKGKTIVLDGFTIRNVCVTNLEYKTFLADLLAQNRQSDYLSAQIRTDNWIKQDYVSLANSYFQEEMYNDFPAVNVSRKGAELFCKWMEEELKSYVFKNKLKFPDLKIRLPYDKEAIFAAREGYSKISFGEGYNTIYDESEGFVDHQFTKRVELGKKRVKRIDTLYDIFDTNKYGWKEKELTDFFAGGNKYYRNIPGDSIYAERMKVLSKIGRVSEMILQKDPDQVWLGGQTWKTKAEYLKLESDFKNDGSSPFVGFRIVVIDPNDPEYKNPFW
jgi:hypothetical protein